MHQALTDFVNAVKPHEQSNSAPPLDPGLRHLWESMLLWSVKERVHAECGILDYGCGGGT
jgi:hypothetical protein